MMRDTKAAAKRLGVSTNWLEKLRVVGGGPEFCKFGKAVRYEDAALDRWIAERRQRSTSNTRRSA